MKTFILALIIGGLFMLSCGPTNNTTTPVINNVPMLSGSWELTYITGPRIAFDGLFPNRKPTIIFDVTEKRITGNTGCNTYSAALVAENNTINLKGPIVLTKMMCADGSLGETTYLEVLKKVTRFSVTGGNTLNFMAGELPLMRFTKK